MGDQHFELAVNSVWEKTRGSHKARHYAGNVTVPATFSPPTALLADFDTRLQMSQTETLAEGIKRVTMEQLEWGAAGFFDGEELFASAIHESRKSIKRVRSLLRLIRYELPPDVYRYEDRSLQKTGQMISEVRSASAIAATARMIDQMYGEFLAPGAFEETIAKLERRRDILELHALEDPNLVTRVVRTFERAYHRYSSWPTDPEAREVYGLGIRDSYEAISPGLTKTYSRGRREMVTAFTRTSPHAFHAWRKRAKYLRHQMEFLAPLWPEAIAAMAVTLDRLGEVLGEDHDLQELNDLIHVRSDLCPNPRERSFFGALISQRRSELQVAAEVLGRRVFAEKPEWLEHRFGEYWDSRALVNRRHLDTLAIS
jgi:CHAD domain-containing protein